VSAEIIQFGRQERRTPAQVFDAAPRALIEKASVRFVFDDELYEVEFHDGDVEHVYLIKYRVNADGVQEMRRRRWWAYYKNSEWQDPLNPRLEAEARRALKRGSSIDAAPLNTAALAQLASRLGELLGKRDKLDSMIRQVEAAIAGARERISN
jgi:hypothetical protein